MNPVANASAGEPGWARALRTFFGLFWVGSGMMGLLGLQPPPSSSPAGLFLTGLEATGYLLPLMCLVQVLAGGLLLSRRLAPLALVMLAPVMVQVLGFRLFLGAPRMLPVALLPLLVHVVLAWQQRTAFTALFAWPGRTDPAAS